MTKQIIRHTLLGVYWHLPIPQTQHLRKLLWPALAEETQWMSWPRCESTEELTMCFLLINLYWCLHCLDIISVDNCNLTWLTPVQHLLPALINPFAPFLFPCMSSPFSSIVLGVWDLCLALTASLDDICSHWAAAGEGWDAITEGFVTSSQLWAHQQRKGLQPVTPSALARSSATEPPFIITCAHQGTSRAALHPCAVPHLWQVAMNTNSSEYMGWAALQQESICTGSSALGPLRPAQWGRRHNMSHQVPSMPHFYSKSLFKSQIKKHRDRRIIL